VPLALPVQPLDGLHWLLALTHLPLEQSPSATQRHAVPPVLRTGAGVSVVVQPVPPLVVQATDEGAATHPLVAAVPLPLQLEPLQTHWPLSH
jgi:hypothetical protein